MNKVGNKQSHVLARLRKVKNVDITRREPEESKDRQAVAKQTLTGMPDQEMVSTQSPLKVPVHKKDISFNKLSDWFDAQPNSFRIIIKQKQQMKSPVNHKSSNLIDKGHPQGPPKSSQSARLKVTYPRRQEMKPKLTLQTQTKKQIQTISNRDIDTLIKQVMQDREEEYARIVNIDMTKNFNANLNYRLKGRRAASSLSRSKLFRNSMTIDSAIEQQTLESTGHSYFPARKHRRTGSMRCNHVNPMSDRKSKTIESPLNIHDVKKILQKYNTLQTVNRDRLRNSLSPSPRYQNQQVGVIGHRITPRQQY